MVAAVTAHLRLFTPYRLVLLHYYVTRWLPHGCYVATLHTGLVAVLFYRCTPRSHSTLCFARYTWFVIQLHVSGSHHCCGCGCRVWLRLRTRCRFLPRCHLLPPAFCGLRSRLLPVIPGSTVYGCGLRFCRTVTFGYGCVTLHGLPHTAHGYGYGCLPLTYRSILPVRSHTHIHTFCRVLRAMPLVYCSFTVCGLPFVRLPRSGLLPVHTATVCCWFLAFLPRLVTGSLRYRSRFTVVPPPHTPVGYILPATHYLRGYLPFGSRTVYTPVGCGYIHYGLPRCLVLDTHFAALFTRFARSGCLPLPLLRITAGCCHTYHSSLHRVTTRCCVWFTATFTVWLPRYTYAVYGYCGCYTMRFCYRIPLRFCGWLVGSGSAYLPVPVPHRTTHVHTPHVTVYRLLPRRTFKHYCLRFTVAYTVYFVRILILVPVGSYYALVYHLPYTWFVCRTVALHCGYATFWLPHTFGLPHYAYLLPLRHRWLRLLFTAFPVWVLITCGY